MALMGRRPHVVRIGENTQGVFSDVWGRRLPNGWTFGVPSELFLTASGQSFDRYGVPPDIRSPVFREADLATGRDPALERAQQVLAPR
jgi:C-terminal processing protease CtpA/Prc